MTFKMLLRIVAETVLKKYIPMLLKAPMVINRHGDSSDKAGLKKRRWASTSCSAGSTTRGLGVSRDSYRS